MLASGTQRMTSTDALDQLAAALENTCNQQPVMLETARALRVQVVRMLTDAQGNVDFSIARLTAVYIAIKRAYLHCYRRTPEEEALLQHCLAALKREGEQTQLYFVGALMLAWHPCEVGLPRRGQLHDSLRALWLQLSLDMPYMYPYDGGCERLAEFLREVCLTLRQPPWVDTLQGQELSAIIGNSSAFLQVYFNEMNLRPLMEARAMVIEEMINAMALGIDQCRRLRRFSARPRIGFVSLGPAHDEVEGAYLAAFMEHLPRENLEIRLYRMSPTTGVIGEVCKNSADVTIPLQPSVSGAIRQLREDDLDIAIFVNNVTARSHVATTMAAHRVARVQMMNLASPITTGFRSIDYMISAIANEPAGTQDHYSERLLLQAGSASCYALDYLLKAEGQTITPTRADLSLPPDAVVYYSSGNFYKLHPALLRRWIDVLKRVPDSYLLLTPFGPLWGKDYPGAPLSAQLNQLCREAGVSPGRIIVAGAMPTMADLHALIRLTDIFLDPYPFTSATSLYDPLRVGLPVVACSRPVSRGRHSPSILEQSGLGDWVTYTEGAYVERAVALGLDANLRAAAKAQLAAVTSLSVIDTASFGPRFRASLDAAISEWNARADVLRATDLPTLARRVEALAQEARHRMGKWGDVDIMMTIILPYLMDGPAAAMVDVGACVGIYSIPLLRRGWRSHMFEPDPRCHPKLQKLVGAFPGAAHLQAAAVVSTEADKIDFHIARTPGLSGLHTSPYDADAGVLEVAAVNVMDYLKARSVDDIRFVKIDAEGHDLAILRSIDFSVVRPDLIMVEYGEDFEGQTRQSIDDTLRAMRETGYDACVFCLRASGDFKRQEWRTELAAIGVNAAPAEIPPGRLFGNIVFYRSDDRDFLPSVANMLTGIVGGGAPLLAAPGPA